MKMNTKKVLFGFMAVLLLVAVSCSPNTSSDDEVYEQGIKKGKLIDKI